MNVLLKKYDLPVPRYTSYPTVPYWQEEAPAEAAWLRKVTQAFRENPEISLYVHLPFCERLCTYCGCNKRITRNHRVEQPYIESLLAEWKLYVRNLPGCPVLKEVHFGGGTPTFFSPEHLARLMEGILENADAAPAHEFGFEAHPASTTEAHLQTLYDFGFRRISVGVQDFDNEILRIINRLQTFEDVERVTMQARAIGYESINYDLIFGLPLQTTQHIISTMEKIQRLRPGRLAFYSYAHVPWIKPSQRAYSEADLPLGENKRALYELGRELLETNGYREIGMDHFALPGDSLCLAMEGGTLHRNFMGYTPHFTRLSLALGASSINDSWDAFVQNEKEVEAYQALVAQGRLPIRRGHWLDREDLLLRQHILNIMCRFETSWELPELRCKALDEGIERLYEMEADGIVELTLYNLTVTEQGRPFLRNICMALDAHYWRKQPEGRLFSQAV